MLSFIFYLSSFLFLFFKTKKAKEWESQLIYKTGFNLLADIINVFNFDYSENDWRNSKLIQKCLENTDENVSLRTFIEICAFAILVQQSKSISIANKIANAINNYHYLIIIGAIILLLTRYNMFEFLFATLVVLFSILLFSMALIYKQASKQALKEFAISIGVTEENSECIIDEIYYYYTFKMMQAPGAAVQWILNLFRLEKD